MSELVLDRLTVPKHLPSRTFAAVLRRILLHCWRTPGLHSVFQATVHWLPASVRRRVEHERTRAREEELALSVRNRPRLVPESELRAVLSHGLRDLAARHGRESLGDYLEFGVYNGTSLTCMHHVLKEVGLDDVRLFGFDSFEGFPAHAAVEDEGRWQPGRCYSPLKLTQAVLDAEGIDWRRVTLVPGWFSDTLNDRTRAEYGITKASVIMIDCDLYSSTKEALAFCAPLIRDEALVLFDEYYPKGLESKNLGERKAFQEFLQEFGCFEAVSFRQYAPRTQGFFVSRKGLCAGAGSHLRAQR